MLFRVSVSFSKQEEPKLFSITFCYCLTTNLQKPMRLGAPTMSATLSRPIPTCCRHGGQVGLQGGQSMSQIVSLSHVDSGIVEQLALGRCAGGSQLRGVAL
jgi:hypothetical protein